MDINSWLTIVTVALALVALLPNEERSLLKLKLPQLEFLTILFLIGFLIPYLILFPQLLERLPFLSKFTLKNGFQPANIAFGIFYLILIWVLIRVFVLKPKNRINAHIISYYTNLLFEAPFQLFFSIFEKYTPQIISLRQWQFYKAVILNPVFIKNIIITRPSYLFNLWEKINNNEDFKPVFIAFLENYDSAYYKDIKATGSGFYISSHVPFLQTVLVWNLAQTKENEVLPILSDYSRQLIKQEKNRTASIYDHEPFYNHVRGEEGFNLPLYYHIRFISLMYTSAIEQKTDLWPHMHTIYSGMIEEITDNLRPYKTDEYQREYPTNYHWLIGEIFSSINHWLETFGGEHRLWDSEEEREFDYIYFKANSSYTDYIPSCFGFCLEELYKGYKENKIDADFIARMIYYHVLTYYFSHYALNELRSSIEKNVLERIPSHLTTKKGDTLLEHVLTFALDEKFALRLDDLAARRFRGSEVEKTVLIRLADFLNKRQLF